MVGRESVGNVMDTYHFWSSASKLEDLELLRDGELAHLHFEDVPDTPPREIQGQPHRALPGRGIAPLRRHVPLCSQVSLSSSPGSPIEVYVEAAANPNIGATTACTPCLT